MGKDELQQMTMLLASVVRNKMEQFHCEHLSDEQMAELNPIIRNAIYSGLWALTHQDPKSEDFVKSYSRLIPRYWEMPQLVGTLTGEDQGDK